MNDIKQILKNIPTYISIQKTFQYTIYIQYHVYPINN